MTPYDIRVFRDRFNLSRDQLADLLETHPAIIKRMESPVGCKQHRPLAARMLKIMRAYQAGHRFN